MKFGSLRNDVFERRRSTGSGFFVLLRHDFEQMFGQIFSIRVKALSNTILASVKAYYNRKRPTSGCRSSLKDVAA